MKPLFTRQNNSKRFSLLLIILFTSLQLQAQDLINLTMTVTEVTHNFQCCDDAAGISCGFLPNRPEPRYRVSGGYQNNSGGFTMVGPASINLGNGVSCGTTSRNDLFLNASGVCADEIRIVVDMWEEDGCGSDNTYDTGCINNDENRSQPTTNVALTTPGTFTTTLNGSGGYSVTVTTTWSVVPAPSVSGTTSICQGQTTTLTASTGQVVGGSNFQWYDAPTGGTLQFTGAVFTTPALASNTTYYVDYGPGGCSTARTPVTVNITPANAPSVTPGSACPGQSATLSANASGALDYNWYNDASMTTLLGSGSSFVTPPLSGTTTFYVTAVYATCESPVAPVIATELAAPASPSAPAVTSCTNSDLILTAIGSGGTINWYSDPSGTISVGTGSPLNLGTQAIGSYTYYVGENDGTCESLLTALPVTIVDIPGLPTANSIDICPNASATLLASEATATNFNWYNSSSATVPVATGAIYTTSPLTTPTSFYVSSINSAGCEGNRLQVDVNLISSPAPSASGTLVACEGQTATFSSNASGAVDYNWYQYSDKTGYLGSGSNYTTNPLSTTSTFYVSAVYSNGCESLLTPITVTVNPSPANPSGSSPTVCEGTDVIISGTGSGSGDLVFYDNSLTEIGRITMGGSSTVAYNAGILAAGTYTFYVSEDNGTCESIRTTVPVIVDSPSGIASVSISESSNTICAGTPVTFTSSPINEGSSPTYQWYINGNPVGGNSAVFTSSTLVDADIISLDLTSNAYCIATPTASSNQITMTVSPNVTPTVSITASSTTICNGTNVTFTATSTNGGTTPVYEWYINGVAQGSNTATFNSSTLVNGDIVSASITSSSTCAIPTSVNSNAITINVSNSVTPSVTIGASNTTICQGSSVTFTASQTSGGVNPSYQWYVNGNPAGTNNSTFTSTSMMDGDVVSLTMTSSEACATVPTASSNTITMSVNSTATPTVSITASSTTICGGSNVTFTATSSNGGTTPVYDWFINGVSQATNANTFASSTLSDGDIVSASITSSSPCAVPTSVNSNAITINVSNSVTPSVTIGTSNTTICQGSDVIVTASQTNGGVNPSYQWYVNGNPAGTNNSTFTSSSMMDGDVVSLTMTSSETCATAPTASSNTINMTVTPSGTPIVFINTPSNIFCPGQNITISSTVTNGGPGVQYDWYLNGTSTGVNTPTYSSTTFNDGDIIMLITTSTANCISPAIVTSNNITMISNTLANPSLSITSLTGTVCEGESITFLATGNNIGSPITYQWTVNGTNVGSNNTVYSSLPLVAGDVIEVTLDYQDACMNTNTITSNQLVVNPAPIVNAGLDLTILEGSVVQINATSSISGVYSWTPASGLDDPTILNPMASPDITTEYIITATTPNGCSSSDNITINLESTDLEIFSSFSPNEDGINDTWVIKNADLYPEISVKIFNRWGNLLYEQNNTYIPWDGKFKDQDLPSETYFYIIILDDTIEPFKGPVTIVR